MRGFQDDQLLLDCVDILLVKAANVDCYHMDTIIIAVLSIQIEQADNSTNSKPTVLSKQQIHLHNSYLGIYLCFSPVYNNRLYLQPSYTMVH